VFPLVQPDGSRIPTHTPPNAKGPEHEPEAFVIRADDGIRTRDPHLGKVTGL